jgi:hypothetical protein
MKRFSFKRFASKKLSIVLPENFLKDHLEIYLMCDSYIGLDQSYEIDLIHVNEAIQAEQRN